MWAHRTLLAKKQNTLRVQILPFQDVVKKRCGYAQVSTFLPVLVYSNAPFTSTKKSFSALELQRQLGHKYYEPIWAMLHKLRAVMGKRDSKYQLDQINKHDEVFFKAPLTDNQKDNDEDKSPKRGKGS